MFPSTIEPGKATFKEELTKMSDRDANTKNNTFHDAALNKKV